MTTPRLRIGTDDHRLAPQLGAVEQLDGDEERVHVDMGDRRFPLGRVPVHAFAHGRVIVGPATDGGRGGRL